MQLKQCLLILLLCNIFGSDGFVPVSSHATSLATRFSMKPTPKSNIRLASTDTDLVVDEIVSDELSARKSLPDRFVTDITSLEGIKVRYPQLPEEFLASIKTGSELFNEFELEHRLMVAKTLARMATLTLLMRGENVLSDDFVFYSPCTGSLNKNEYLGLLRTIDRAFPSIATIPENFTVYKDGIVTYEMAYRASFEGTLIFGEESISPNFKTAISNVELCVVNLDNDGLLCSFSTGVVIAEADEYKDPSILERIEFLESKIAGNKIKVEGLAGQEHTIAYQKSVEEISNLEVDLSYKRDQVDVEANTGNAGGLKGLFDAVGLSWTDQGHALIGTAPHKRVGGGLQGGIVVPSEVTVPIPTYGPRG